MWLNYLSFIFYANAVLIIQILALNSQPLNIIAKSLNLFKVIPYKNKDYN